MIQLLEKRVLDDEHTIAILQITNAQGASVTFCNFGARWTSCIVPDKQGKLEEILLGLDSIDACLKDNFYKGATIGRVANRIGNASFYLNGKQYQLETNDGLNSNHGGFHGFSHRIWDYYLPDGLQGSKITFVLHSSHGEGGFPGNIDVQVTYTWTDDNQLIIQHETTTDQDTYVNLTCHAYFNLSGKKTKIYEHLLEIPAKEILETNEQYIPTGELLPVKNTPFDFTHLRPIGDIGCINNESIRQNRGYNHCYVLSQDPTVILQEPISGRQMKMNTTLPGVLVYSAGFLTNPSTAICLETQFWPDTPNHANFPSCLLHPGETYKQKTKFAFFTP